MKKLALLLNLVLLLTGAKLSAQNPTQVRGTNGLVNVPTNRFTGRVSIGLDTNGLNPSVQQVFGHDASGVFGFQSVSGGTPAGSSGDIQFNNAGAFGGSNAFRVLFSGNDFSITNAAGGVMTFSAPTTNVNFYTRRAVFGPNGTIIPEQYSDVYIKGQHPTISSFRHDSTSGETFVGWYLDDASLGGFDFYMGRPSGNPCLNIFMGTAATSPIFFRGVGAQDMQFGAQAGNVVSLGTFSGATFTSRMDVQTNGVNGKGFLITNFANLYSRYATVDHSQSIVDTGNPTEVLINALQYKNGAWLQNGPAINDTFHAWVNLKAGTYTFFVNGIRGSNRGSNVWRLVSSDGLTTNTLGGHNWYNAVDVVNVRNTIAGVTVPYDGAWKIQSVAADKDAASSNYYISLSDYGFNQ